MRAFKFVLSIALGVVGFALIAGNDPATAFGVLLLITSFAYWLDASSATRREDPK